MFSMAVFLYHVFSYILNLPCLFTFAVLFLLNAFSSSSGAAMRDLSCSLSRFCHTLVSSTVLSEQLQDSLLNHLSLSPTSVDPWPLTVYPRSLAVLAEILLLRLQQEREAGSVKAKSEEAIINIWTRFLAQLKDAVLNFNNVTDQWDGKWWHTHWFLSY